MWYSLILLVIIFLLGSASLGIVFSYQMIGRTEQNLWSGLPAVVSIEEDLIATRLHWETEGVWVDPPITPELMEEISHLPYVDRVDSSLKHHLYGRNLNRHWDSEAGIDNLSLGSFGLDDFDVKGVTQSEFLELISGILEIVSGTTFTNEQLASGTPVVLISQELADVNDLEVGSLITLETLHPRHVSVDGNLVIEFEVIGIYELRSTLNEFANIYLNGHSTMVIEGRNHRVQELNLLNQMYIPYVVLAYMVDSQTSTLRSILGEDVFSEFIKSENFILLNDPRELPDFHRAVAEILPEFLMARDVTDSFKNVFTAMDHIRNASSFILILFIGASMIVLFLLIIFLIQNRSYEIGIYLALGEKKWRVRTQFMIEIVSISFVAITLSLFTSQILSAQIAHYMVREEMANVQVSGNTGIVELGYNHFMDRGANSLDWFVPEVSEIERLIELSDVSLSAINIIIFYFASFVIIIASTVLSTSYIMRLNPKEVLL